MGLQSRQKTPFFARHKEHDYMHKQDIWHDHSGNIINHATYYVSQRKSIAHVLDKRVYFRFTQNNRLLKGPPKERELSFR